MLRSLALGSRKRASAALLNATTAASARSFFSGSGSGSYNSALAAASFSTLSNNNNSNSSSGGSSNRSGVGRLAVTLSAPDARPVLYVCDVQETFRPPVLPQLPAVIVGARALMQIARALDMPVFVSEQRPFKPTVAELRTLYDPAATGDAAAATSAPTSTPAGASGVPRAAPGVTVVGDSEVAFAAEGLHPVTLLHKSSFSMLGDGHAPRLLAGYPRAVVLAGIEGHVCVLQTARDLLQRGVSVWLPADAVASSDPAACAVALEQLRADGAVITTVESVAFELMGTAKNPAFKSVIAVIKDLKKRKDELAAATAAAAAGKQ